MSKNKTQPITVTPTSLDAKERVLEAIERGKARLEEEKRRKEAQLRAQIAKEQEQQESHRERARLFVLGTLPDLIERAAAGGESRLLIDDDKHDKTPYIAQECEAVGLTVYKEYEPAQSSWDGFSTIPEHYKYYVIW